MKESNKPLVSVVTPVYNGEKYLSECIESIIAQSYENWEYIILDNRSTDDTLEIAKRYAAKDDRIKVITNDEFLHLIPNWNEALRKISTDSKYCKVVHADDWITPNCLEQMVARAEEYPTAGIISAYRFVGTNVRGLRGKGLSYDTTFMTGKEAGRRVIKDPLFLFGSPSTVLYRADLVRQKESFYDQSVVHADTDVCYNILTKSNFAFVHQLLSFTRLHEESVSTFADYYRTYILHDLYAIKKYGHYFLAEEEYQNILSSRLDHHHHILVKLMYNGRGREVWNYHEKELEKMGLSIDYSKVGKDFICEAAKVKPPVKWIRDRFKNLFSATDKENKRQEVISNKKETVVGNG